MMKNSHSRSPDTSPGFFDALYRRADDPWNFRHSSYERSRYKAIADGVNDRYYASAFEPGCAIGELTALLAPLCRRLTAMDFSAVAVERARRRCSGFSQVETVVGAFPDDMPDQDFDLIVFSELGYYFTVEELVALTTKLWQRLEPGGRFIACHWLGRSEDHRLHGTEVHRILENIFPGKSDFTVFTNPGYVLQRWAREDGA